MSVTALKFSDTEFRAMPISRFKKYLTYCEEYNEIQKQSIKPIT